MRYAALGSTATLGGAYAKGIPLTTQKKGEIVVMCEYLGKCEACIYETDCKHDHLGTGTMICSDFECSCPVDVCDRRISCFELDLGYEDDVPPIRRRVIIIGDERYE